MEQFFIQIGTIGVILWAINTLFNIKKENKYYTITIIICIITYFICGIIDPQVFKAYGYFVAIPIIVYFLYQIWLGLRYLTDR